MRLSFSWRSDIVFPSEEGVKALSVVQGPLREAPVVGDLGDHTPRSTPERDAAEHDVLAG